MIWVRRIIIGPAEWNEVQDQFESDLPLRFPSIWS
jgi:hypothetical protein